MILKETYDDKKDEYTKIWNLVSEVDKCIIFQKSDERNDVFHGKVKMAFNSEPDDILKELESTSDNSEKKSINDIAISNKKPQAMENDRSEKSILSFTDFLIQVLWLTIDNEDIPVSDFFNRHKLLETFHKYLFKNEETKKRIPAFFSNLLRYRLLFDYFIIRINSADGKTNNYSLNFYQENDNGDDQHHEHKQQLIQYQSMLYVSTSHYLWLSFILKALNKNHGITYKELIDILKNWDNERHKDARCALEYDSIDRYWFWRLDYYLWENRSVQFKITDFKKVADSYIFKSNRSIEHIAPQTPKSESNIKLCDDLLHQFGNLAMISAGQNSSLKNESYEVKRAYVQSFVNKSVGGTIESLKLLKVHECDTWNEENVKQHHNEMIDILIDSFCPGETTIEHLRKQKTEADAI
jgi:hypothetical protein